MQFYPGDWLKDPCLGMCQPATRGIWMDLLSVMHESDRSGVIAGTREQIARLCRCSAVELGLALSELSTSKTADVTERNSHVTVINRRMQREYKDRIDTRLRVKRHRGNAACNGDETGHISYIRDQRSYIRDQKSEIIKEEKRIASLIFPLSQKFTGAAFRDAWQKWLVRRSGMKKPKCGFLPLFTEQLAWLETFPEASATESLNNSLRNGYTGLFPDSRRSSTRPQIIPKANDKF